MSARKGVPSSDPRPSFLKRTESILKGKHDDKHKMSGNVGKAKVEKGSSKDSWFGSKEVNQRPVDSPNGAKKDAGVNSMTEKTPPALSGSKLDKPLPALTNTGKATGEQNRTMQVRVDAEKPASAAISMHPMAGTHSTFLPVPTSDFSPEYALPQPKDTQSLINEFMSIRALFHQHVSNFYEEGELDVEVLGSKINSAALVEVVYRIQQPRQWVEHLANVQTRSSALTFILCYAIMKRLDPDGNASKSLLPRNNVYCMQAMQLSPSQPAELHDALVSRWKAITGFLQHDRYVTNAFRGHDPRLQYIDNLIRTLDEAIGPLAIASTNAARRNNLLEIVKRAAQLGHTLMSQPSTWQCSWSRPNLKEKGDEALIEFPALIQITDDGGQRLKSPHVFVEMEFSQRIRL